MARSLKGTIMFSPFELAGLVRQISNAGPGARNPLKNVLGRWSYGTHGYRLRDGSWQDTGIPVRTFTSVVTGRMPHQNTREINRRLRQAQKKAS